MARIRTIKPDMGESRDIAKLSFAARYFFALLLCHLDDEGRAEWLPRKLTGAMYTHDKAVSDADLEGWLDECCAATVLKRYSVDGVDYIFSPTFKKHQTISKFTGSKCPIPTDSSTTPVPLQEDSGSNPGKCSDGKGKEVGKEVGSRKGKEELPTVLCPVADAVIQELSALTGKPFDVNARYCGGLRARIEEGATQDLLLAVVRHKHKQWGRDVKMRQYLVPDTLFGPQNFEKYSLEVLPSGDFKQPETDMERRTREVLESLNA